MTRWFTGHCPGKSKRQGHKRRSLAKTVGATSAEGFQCHHHIHPQWS